MDEDKVVYFIRHAESTNNVAKRTLKRTLGSFRAPRSTAETMQLISLLTVPMDTPLSADGRRMIQEQRSAVEELVARESISIVYHSPLKRARDTATGLFSGLPKVPLLEIGHLHETSLAEHARLRSLDRRVLAATVVLRDTPLRRMAIVGHSGFFRRMLPAMAQRKEEVGNVSVWRATLGADCQWRDVELVLPGWRNGFSHDRQGAKPGIMPVVEVKGLKIASDAERGRL